MANTILKPGSPEWKAYLAEIAEPWHKLMIAENHCTQAQRVADYAAKGAAQ